MKKALRVTQTLRALAVVMFGHRPPARPLQTHRQDRLQYAASQLASAQCNKRICLKVSETCRLSELDTRNLTINPSFLCIMITTAIITCHRNIIMMRCWCRLRWRCRCLLLCHVVLCGRNNFKRVKLHKKPSCHRISKG